MEHAGDDIRLARYRCNCGHSNCCAITPSSPVIAKHRCPHCNRTNEIETSQLFGDFMADHKQEGKEDERTRRRRSFHVTVSTQLERDLVAMREERLAQLPKVPTPWGAGVLIG